METISDRLIKQKYGDDAIITGHFPFRNLEMLQRHWKREAKIVKIAVDGSFSYTIDCNPLVVPELEPEVKGGYWIAHDLVVRCRYDHVLTHPVEGEGIRIQKIFQELIKPRVINVGGIPVTATPSTLNVKEMTILFNEKNYIFEGKVPKEIIKKSGTINGRATDSILTAQVKEWKKKGDKDPVPGRLDLIGKHTVDELLELKKIFPPGWFFLRICQNKAQAVKIDKLTCMEIWNDGTVKTGGA